MWGCRKCRRYMVMQKCVSQIRRIVYAGYCNRLVVWNVGVLVTMLLSKMPFVFLQLTSHVIVLGKSPAYRAVGPECFFQINNTDDGVSNVPFRSRMRLRYHFLKLWAGDSVDTAGNTSVTSLNNPDPVLVFSFISMPNALNLCSHFLSSCGLAEWHIRCATDSEDDVRQDSQIVT